MSDDFGPDFWRRLRISLLLPLFAQWHYEEWGAASIYAEAAGFVDDLMLAEAAEAERRALAQGGAVSRSRPGPVVFRTTPEYRAERRRKCAGYLRRAGSLPEARKLAKAEGFGADTSVWIGALADLLAGSADDR